MQVSAQLVVRVEPRIKKKLAQVVRRLDTTIQSAVNQALSEWLDKQGLSREPAE